MDNHKIFPSTTDSEDVRKLLVDARTFNNSLDKEERKRGAIMREMNFTTQLRTAMSALSAGMSLKDWTNVAQAFCMLQDCELAMRKEGMPS